MSVLAQSAGTLWRVIESYGLEPAPFFVAEGLELELPIEPGTRVPYEAIDAIRARAAEASGDPAFGLRVAQCLHPSYLGALGYAVLASNTLRVAFERIHRYVRVLNEQGRFDLVEDDEALRARLSVGQESMDRVARDDGQLAALFALCRLNAGGDFTPLQVAFVHGAPDDPTPYEALFGCPVIFGADANEFSITLMDADRVLPSSNEVLAQMNERIVIQRLAQLDRDNVSGRVRAAIMELLPSGEVSDEAVADALHMTARTMHRRLKEDGESFRTLLTAVRRDLAEQYLADTSLTLTEITFLLGFSEMSSFSRAYKHWTGQPPSAARQAN
jgi:AraC-like DNA-binding protein